MDSVTKLKKLLPSSYELPSGMSDERLLRFMCQKDFLCFCMAVMPTFSPTKFHTFLVEKLQNVYLKLKQGEDVRLMIEMPPRHGKTTLASVLFPAWIMGKEKWPYVCASYGASLAERNSQDCRDIVESAIYKIIFPNVRLDQDSTSKEFWKTSKKSTYRAVGVGGGLTGMGFSVGACDDPFAGRAEADSATIRESTWKWWQSVFMTRREGRSAVLVLNTRWHLDDLTGKLLEQQENLEAAGLVHDKWERFRFPAIADEDEYIDGKLFRKAGEALWPEKFSLADLEKTKQSTDVYEWSSLYQQEPILQENATFKSEWFKYFTDEDIKDKDLMKFTLVDLAISKKKTADNTVVMTMGKDRNGPNWYVLEYTSGHFDPLQTVETIFDHCARYGSNAYIEAVAFQSALASFVLEEQRRRQAKDTNWKPFVVNDIKHAYAQKKEERISGLIPYFKNGTLLMRKSMVELQKELLTFPKGKKDDHPDCMSFFIGLKILTVFNKPEEEKKDTSFTAMWRARQGQNKDFDANKAFNSVT